MLLFSSRSNQMSHSMTVFHSYIHQHQFMCLTCPWPTVIEVYVVTGLFIALTWASLIRDIDSLCLLLCTWSLPLAQLMIGWTRSPRGRKVLYRSSFVFKLSAGCVLEELNVFLAWLVLHVTGKCLFSLCLLMIKNSKNYLPLLLLWLSWGRTRTW